MNKPHTVINLAGKQYLINKNLEQGALMNIINKLQTDLTHMKYLSQNQQPQSAHIISDTQLSCIKSEATHSLKSGASSLHNAGNAELRSRLKKNYEEKVQNLINLYEKRINEFKEKIKFLEDDREAFAEALEVKHKTIAKMKLDLHDLETQKREEIEEMKKVHDAELGKLRNELTISETCYKDLEQVRKYLEKNNNLMKNEINETQANCEKKILKIADEYENEKRKYKTEIKQIRKMIEDVELQAQAKLTQLEESRESAVNENRAVVEQLRQEVDDLKEKLKIAEEDKQKLQTETRAYEDKLRHTNIYYEAKMNNLNVCALKDREHYLEEIEAIKGKFEKQFSKLEEEYVVLERDVELKKKEFLECEALKKQLTHEVADLRTELDLSNRKHTEEYELLKQNFENAKKSYEGEHSKLKATLLDKEKIADDLDIANKKYEKQYNSLKNTIKTIKEEAEMDNEKMWEKLKTEKLFYQEEIAKINAELGNRIQKQEEDISRVKQENSELMEKIDKLETSKRTLEKSNRDLRLNMDSTFEQYKDDVDRITRDLETKKTEYESRIEELESEVEKHQKSIHQLEDLNQMLQSTNEEYKTQCAENSTKYMAEIGRLRDEISMTKRFHADDLSSIQKQLDLKEQMEKEKDERIQKLKQQITNIKQTQSSEVDEKLEKIEKVKKDLESENTILKHRMNDLTEDFLIQKDKYETTQNRLKKRYEEELQKLREDKEEMGTTIDNLEKMISDQERENKFLKNNLEDISKRQLDDTVDLQESLALTRHRYDDKIQKLKQDLEASRRNYEADLEKTRDEFHADRQQYEETIQELKLECNSRKMQNQELEAARAELEKNWQTVKKDEYKKLAFLGTMGNMKFIEDDFGNFPEVQADPKPTSKCLMGDQNDDLSLTTRTNKSLSETVQDLQKDLSDKETECGYIKANLKSDIVKLKQKLKQLKSEQEENARKNQEESERNLEAAFKQYERNVQFIRSRHQENIQVLQSKHEEEVQETTSKYEEQISLLRRQVQDLPNLRVSLQSKEEEIQVLQEEIKNNKKNYDDRVTKLIQDLEDEKLEEQAEKWDLKKYVEIFKKRCLVLETMLKNLQRTNSDLKDKIKETNKSCDVKIAKAKIDYETKQRAMEEQLQELRQELENERQQSTRKANKAHQKLEEDRVTYESKILMLNDQIEEQKNTRKFLEAKTTELEEKISVFRDAVTKIKDQYEITLKEIRIETDLKNKTHKEEIEQLVRKIEEVKLRSELDINEEKEKGNTRIEELTRILQEQNLNLKPEIPEMKGHEVQTDPCNLEAETLTDFTKHLEEIREKYQNERTEYENTISRLNSEMDEQKACFLKFIELKQQLEVTSINLETSSESNKKYFKEFIKLKKDFDTSKKHYDIQIRKHHQEVQKYKNTTQELQGRNEKLKRDYDQQVKICSNLLKEKQELEDVNEGMKAKFSETTKAIDAHMDILKTTIDDNKTFYVETVLQLKDQIEEQMKQRAALEERLEREIQEAVEAERKKLSQNIDQREEVLQQMEKQNQEISRLQKELEKQSEEVNKIKDSHLNDITKLRQHYEKEMQHTDDLILILTNDLEHNNKKYNKLKQLKAKTVSHTKTQITTIQKTYEEKLRSLEKQLESSNSLLEITNTNLKKEIEQLHLNKELLEKSKTHVETENKRYQSKIDDLTRYCEKLKADMEHITSKYEECLKDRSCLEENEKSGYETVILELKNTIETSKKEYEEYIRKLKDDIKRGKTYIEQLIEIKGSLENKLVSYEKKVATLQKYVSDTFMKCNNQLAETLSINDVTTFERI